MRRKAYRATRVKDVEVARLTADKAGEPVSVGIDMGKHSFYAVCRWTDGTFERPWKIDNPGDILGFVELLERLGQGRKRQVAMESSGTYGDALRQALADAGIELQRVSGKAAHDYAEIFDGVPSQHDGKDAAVVAELAALGKSVEWKYRPAADWDQEVAYWVDWMIGQRQILGLWQGRLEALLARHWPEATRVLAVRSVTLLKALGHYGSPEALAADAEASERLARWGGQFLDKRKIDRLVGEAGRSGGVRAGPWEKRRLQDFARQALQARQQGQAGQRRLRALAKGHEVLQAQGQAVGVPTACVLWVKTGDPRAYYAAAAYRKALGLNLVERSSGEHQGALHISKRGSAVSRQWLYFAVLRLVQKAGVRPWYEAQKARDPDAAQRVLVALMRKLALALHQIGVQQTVFDPQRLLAQVGVAKVAKRASMGAPALGSTV